MKQDEEYLKIIKAETRLWYDKIGKVRCPSLSNDVYFNAQEFHHTSYDGGGRARNAKEIIYKLILLPLACPVIKYAKVVDEYRKEKQSENRKKNTAEKDVEFWSLVAHVGKNRDVKVKVVLKRVGNGNIIFWSIMKLRSKKVISK